MYLQNSDYNGLDRANFSNFYIVSKYLIYIFLAYIIWFKYVYGEYPLILYGSVIGATILMLMDILLSQKDLSNMCPYGVLVNIIMCIYSLGIGLIIARNQTALLSSVKTYFAFSVVCIVICYISKEEGNLDWLTEGLIVIYLICAVFVITRGFYIESYGYVLGIDQNPNDLGLNMDIGLFCLAYKSRKQIERPFKYLIIAAIFIYIVIGCGSRKCLIAAIIITVLWIYPLAIETIKSEENNRKIVVLIGLIVIIFGIYYYLMNYYINTNSYYRMLSLGSTEENSFVHRILYYKYAIDYFMQNPLFGIGLAQFTYWNPLHQYAHSTYAEALADWGFTGCLIYFPPILIVGKHIIEMSFNRVQTYMPRIVLGLWVMELFLGAGQIWFYGMEHLMVWTMIFLYTEMYEVGFKGQRRTYKYVKN